MTVSEKIVQSTLLQAVARVAMAVTLPVLLLFASYIGGLGAAVSQHSTDIALLQQQAAAAERKVEAIEAKTTTILDALQDLKTSSATTKTDVGYLRDWVEEIKREGRPAP